MKRLSLLLVPASLLSMVISARPSQAQLTEVQQRLVDSISSVIVERVEQSSCEEFAAIMAQSESKQLNQNPQLAARFRQAAENNPALREEFVNQISAPLINKMFDCNLVF